MSGESWEWEGRVKEAVVAEQGKVLGGLPALLPTFLPGEEEVCETRLGPPSLPATYGRIAAPSLGQDV